MINSRANTYDKRGSPFVSSPLRRSSVFFFSFSLCHSYVSRVSLDSRWTDSYSRTNTFGKYRAGVDGVLMCAREQITALISLLTCPVAFHLPMARPEEIVLVSTVSSFCASPFSTFDEYEMPWRGFQHSTVEI